MTESVPGTAIRLTAAEVRDILEGRWTPAPPRADVSLLAERFAAAGIRPYHQIGLLAGREVLEAVTRLQDEPATAAEVAELLVRGRGGHLPARVYRPSGGSPNDARTLVVYLHGGGWAYGSVTAADRPCQRLAVDADAVVVSVAYRLSPESPFPLPLEDCTAAVAWLLANAQEVGGDPADVVLLGDSAGGNLAAATALALRDRGEATPGRQVLLYPSLRSAQGSPFGSYAEFVDEPLMPAADVRWFWSCYLDDQTDPAALDDPLAAPLLAEDLRGLPATHVIVAERDVLRDEGLAFALRLAEAGVPTSATLYRGAPHGFWWMDRALEQAAELHAQLGSVVADRSLQAGLTL